MEEDKKVTYETFDDFLNEQDESVKALYDSAVAGLKSALEKEREERKTLSDEIKKLHGKAEKGSEAEKALADTMQKLEEAEARYTETQKQIRFVEQAGKPEIGCVNSKVAWAVAQSEGLFDDEGEPKWDELQKTAPELFKKTSTDAGKTTPNKTYDINAEIRKKAGL